MKKEIYLHVPEPCHENWEQMNAVQQGRFCQSCAKQVIDFSSMTDKQILEVLSKAAGKTCGRFSSDQLERPVVNEIPSPLKPYKFFLSAFIPAFLLANAGSLHAQVKGKVEACTTQTRLIMGKLALAAKKPAKITGEVSSENGEPLPGASITIKGTSIRTVANLEGKFSIDYPLGYQQVMLVVSIVGYASKEIKINQQNVQPLKITFSDIDALPLGEVVVIGYVNEGIEEQNETFAEIPKIECTGKIVSEAGEGIAYATVKLNGRKETVADSNGVFRVYLRQSKKKLKLTSSSAGYETLVSDINLPVIKNDLIKITLKARSVLENAVVKCFATERLTSTVGGFSVVSKVTYRDAAYSFFQKAFNNEMFKAYPNPAVKGSFVNLIFKKPGNYSIQLFDNSGKLYQTKEFKADVSKQTIQLAVPEGMTTGVYFLKAINLNLNKQFVDKLLIQ